LQKELNQELIRYYFLIKTFEKTIEGIEAEMKDPTQWFYFVPNKITKSQLNTLDGKDFMKSLKKLNNSTFIDKQNKLNKK